MANRDFKKIERIMKDFSLGVGEGGGSKSVSEAFAFSSSVCSREVIGFVSITVDFEKFTNYLEQVIGVDLNAPFHYGEIFVGVGEHNNVLLYIQLVKSTAPTADYDELTVAYDGTQIIYEQVYGKPATLKDLTNLLKICVPSGSSTNPVLNSIAFYDNVVLINRTDINDVEVYRIADPAGFFKEILVENGGSSESSS